MISDPSVIIIGAGAAGISAATQLYQNGIQNFTILEAENRIGGRIYSEKFGESYIDLGAQWCHGEKDNIVYSLVKDLNILKSDKILPSLYHSKQRLLGVGFSLKLLYIFSTLYLENPKQGKGSLGDAFTRSYNHIIHEMWQGEEDKISLAEDCLDLMHKWALAFESAFTWFDVSASSNFVKSEGDQLLGWDGLGYKTILEVLMHKYPDPSSAIPIENQIILNKEVAHINWNNPDKKVVVECSDGTSYIGDHVISTVSVGVLRDRYKSMFQPQLPNEKINAIQALGMDGVGKIFFHFPNRWWNDGFLGVGFAWDREELENSANEFPEGFKIGNKSWITAIVFMLPLPKNPNILWIWISGEFLPEIEKLSDETIINGLMYLSNRFIGQDFPNITRPDKMIRNKWYSNPHFRGSYSYETVATQNYSKPQQSVLSEPVTLENGRPVLLFAGEGTIAEHYKSVHGAIETGFREADRLINLYK